MNIFSNSIPLPPPASILDWAESALKVDRHSFDRGRSPQMSDPIEAMADIETRICSLVAPVQSGKSTAGEVVVGYWAQYCFGLIQINLQDEGKAKERWTDRYETLLNSMPELKWADGAHAMTERQAKFINSTVRCQGVFDPNVLNSDTVPYQYNDEIHLWKPGHLSMARDRQTRIWNSKALDSSNASRVGDQWHIAFQSGTMQSWENQCPECKQWFVMHFRYDKNSPEKGGLRYDATARLKDGRVDYNRLEKTIRYQFPCGHEIKNTPASRRGLLGRHGPPQNEGAHVSHKSFISDAVSYHEIPWLMLIQEWHSAYRSLKSGDSEPMFRFITRRECKFFSDDAMPFNGQIVLNDRAKIRNKEGMPGRATRIFILDWQQGYKHLSELTHYWGVIIDFAENCNGLVVYEGMISTDEEIAATAMEYGVLPQSVFIDASKNTKAILSLCYRMGYNAVSGITSHKGSFRHTDGVRRFYSEEKPICAELNMPSLYDQVATPDGYKAAPNEPVIISYNKAGLLGLFFFIRDMKANVTKNKPEAAPSEYIEIVIPSDVSDDFKKHMEAWIRVAFESKKTNDEIEGFQKRTATWPDHMLMCMAYAFMILDWSGLLGDQLSKMGIKTDKLNE